MFSSGQVYKDATEEDFLVLNYDAEEETSPGGGTPIWNRRGYSSEILNLTPKGETIRAWLQQILAA